MTDTEPLMSEIFSLPRPGCSRSHRRARPRPGDVLPPVERPCLPARQCPFGAGLARGDRVAILAYNRVEWAEIFAATAKSGIVAVPINFRLTGPEAQYIAEIPPPAP